MTQRSRSHLATMLLAFVLAAASFVVAASSGAKKDGSAKDGAANPVVRSTDADAMRVEGEQRFHANCGRCHAAPQKFPPRMMATVLRHMRVRATVTSEDQRLILFYMTQ
jgi:cytochrome c5